MAVRISRKTSKVRVDLTHPAASPLRKKLGTEARVIELPWTVKSAVRLSDVLGTWVPTPAYAGGYGGLMTPRAYQRKTVDFIVRNRRGFVLNGLGTGKTASALWAFWWLHQHGMAQRLLVLAPKSTLDFVWLREAQMAVPDLATGVARAPSSKREEVLKNLNYSIVVTNHDAVRFHDPDMIAGLFDMVVVDEATAFKTWRSGGMPKRHRALRKIAHDVPWFWLMTGTPTPNSPEDAWFPITMVRPDWKITRSRWEAWTMVKSNYNPHIKKPKPDATRVVAQHMKPAIRITREEALKELPPRSFITRKPDLSKEQKKALKELKAYAVTELKGQEITAANAAVLLLKLLQVASGGVKIVPDTDEAVELDMTQRLEDIDAVVQDSGAKVIVFSAFRHSVRRITKWLNERHGEGFAAVVYGDVSGRKRNEIFQSFQDDDLPRVIVAHPETASHGLTLTAADTILWVGPPLRAELYEQGNARAWRGGQTKPVTIVNQVASPEEERIFKVLQKREALQSEILSIVKELVS